MARKGSYVAGLLMAVVCVFLRDAEASNAPTYALGFLAPSPDSVLPARLVHEWDSAFKVALEVMNSENRPYSLIMVRKNTQCEWLPGMHAAEALLRPSMVPPLIGAVGPACSDAAMPAARVFWEKNYPIISFAATTEPLSNRISFPTFYRTVFSDRFQAAAIAASVEKLKIKHVTVLITQQYYSYNLGANIADAVGSFANATVCLLHKGDNSSISSAELADCLNKVRQDELVVMAVEPNFAYKIWSAALKLGRTRYPFWYLGTDGVTAFDPADTDPVLVSAIQGEIGVSPPGGDILNDGPCKKFYSYWKAKNYTGSPSEGKTRTRSYVPHLIDAIQTYFVIVDNLIKANISVTKDAVLMALNGSGPGFTAFQGCSGMVSFDKATGSRSILTQVPEYDLVSLTPNYWEVKGEIKNGTLLNLQDLTRPENGYVPNSTNELPTNTKVGIIFGTILGAVAVLFLAVSALYRYLHQRRNAHHPLPTSESMSRKMDLEGTARFPRPEGFRGSA